MSSLEEYNKRRPVIGVRVDATVYTIIRQKLKEYGFTVQDFLEDKISDIARYLNENISPEKIIVATLPEKINLNEKEIIEGIEKTLTELKNEINTIKQIVNNIKIMPNEDKLREIIKCETEECINKFFSDIQTEIKNIPTPEWLDKHLLTCKDPNCSWCAVVKKTYRII